MNLKDFLDKKVLQYNNADFIVNDPIFIPHLYTQQQDIEIAAFFAAIFAWGNRKTIINKSKDLLMLMDNAPYDFIRNHQKNDLKRFLNFKHRTFNATDVLYFINFLQYHYTIYESLQDAFLPNGLQKDFSVQKALIHFHNYVFSMPDAPSRTHKHISTPNNKSTCKRLNMFLRWMVRKDKNGVDFGLWKNIKPSQLLIPIDLHVARVAGRLGMLQKKQLDFNTCLQLTEALRVFDKNDPVKYDFALFGLGIVEKYY